MTQAAELLHLTTNNRIHPPPARFWDPISCSTPLAFPHNPIGVLSGNKTVTSALKTPQSRMLAQTEEAFSYDLEKTGRALPL